VLVGVLVDRFAVDEACVVLQARVVELRRPGQVERLAVAACARVVLADGERSFAAAVDPCLPEDGVEAVVELDPARLEPPR
jgi:hypothetical protein